MPEKKSPPITVAEHEHVTEPPTKRVLLYGWDGSNKVRLKTDSAGVLETSASLSPSASQIVVQASHSSLKTLSQLVGTFGSVATVSSLAGGNPLYTQVLDAAGAPITSFGGGTQYATDAVAPDPATGTALVAERDNALGGITPAEGDWSRLFVDANGALWTHDNVVGAAISGTEMQVDVVAALPAGTNAIGKLAANSGVDIGDVDVLTVGGQTPTYGAGTIAAGTQRVTIATDDEVNNLLGTIDADTSTLAGAVSGTEMQVDVLTMPTVTVTATNLDVQSGGADLATTTQAGAIQTATELIDDAIYVDDADWTADTSKHALVGGVTQVATTANTDGDVTPLTTNAMRELRTAVPESDLATATTSHVKKYYTNAGAVTDGIIWSPAAGKRWYVTDIFIQVSAAATVTLEDDLAGGDAAIWKAELAANSGWSHSFHTPWYSGEDAADLIITTSAGNVYVTVTGYEI